MAIRELLNYLESNYLVSKNQDKTDHNQVKHDFFAGIVELGNSNSLNVARLTERLASLSEEQRYQLFYYGRQWGSSFKEKASGNCEAGQLILKLYNALGVRFTDTTLEALVNRGLTEKGSKYLSSYHYQNWLKNPLSKTAISRLEDELISSLSLDRKNYNSLAEVLHKNEQPLNLELLLEQAPTYFPELMHQLYQLAESNEQRERLINLVLAEVRKNRSLSKIMAEINIDFALALVKEELQNFFALSHCMQTKICSTLEQNKEFTLLKNLVGEEEFENMDKKELFNILNDREHRKAASQNNETFNRLVDKVYERAIENPTQAYAQLQINSAFREIKSYLKKGPANYKNTFFANLAKEIKIKGLSIELLQEHLAASDPERLFDKGCLSGGPKASRAAALIQELFAMASFGADLDIDNLINQGLLPEVGIEEKAKAELKNEIRKLILHPSKGNNSPIQRTMAEAFDYFKSFQQYMHRARAFDQKRAESIYQSYLLEKGLAQASQQERPIFDPQGHVLVTVSLSPEDYDNILKQITNAGGNKEQLELCLGTKLSNSSFCSLDIAEDERLCQKFKNSINSANLILNQNVFSSFFSKGDRGSVIPLQEEMSMHISLCLRSIEKFIKQNAMEFSLSPAGFNELLKEINTLVMTEFSSILNLSCQQDQINYDLLNKGLDKARQTLAPKCRDLLVKAIASEMPDDLFEQFKTELLPNLTDELFTSTTATGLDYLRTDLSNQTIVRITGTEKTAHNKGVGKDEQALRLIARNHLDDSVVTPYPENSIEARIPSIALTKLAHNAAVSDVALKLNSSQNLLSEKLGGSKGPLIYNLLTSLHSNVYDNSFFESGNKQRTSASRILKGSHLHNYRQLASGEIEAFVYVQNIPVNQHTNELNLHSLDDATAEATLMTEFALLTTFKHHASVFSPALRESISKTHQAIHSNYLNFLNQNRDGDHYFKKSDYGKHSIELIEHRKKLWEESLTQAPATNLQELIVQVLFKMTVNYDSQKKQFGALIQTLSIFIEPMSQAGCKSANERYQAISGRVELLKSMNGILPAQRSAFHNQIISTLQNYLNGSAKAKSIQAAMDLAYNKHNLYGASIFSEEDQGAGSKVKATSNTDNPGKISEFNTNYAETNYLSRLMQKFAGAMQAHKAHLAKVFTELFNEIRLVSSSKKAI